MNKDGIVLHSGATLPCDALICGTGWEQTYNFFTEEQRHELGLPVEAGRQTPSESATWSCLNEDADQKLRKKWPAITNPPPYWHKQATQTPYRLYKYIAPLQDPDHAIVFIGQTR
jgi:dimethylaniline monooxygenase (N-oxide forming)